MIVEALIRLEQATYLLRRFRTLELEHDEKDGQLGKTTIERRVELAKRVHELGFEIKLIGEAFYYFAFRARQALRHENGFDLGCETVGVRDVRNHLIEHSDKKSGVLVSWWVFRCPEGLILAPDDNKGLDKGIYPNASEFIDEVTRGLQDFASRR